MTIHHKLLITAITSVCLLFSTISSSEIRSSETRSSETTSANIKKLHSHQDIQKTAIEFVRSQIPEDVIIKDITAGKIDSRIHFRQCSQVLEAKTINNRPITKHQTIGIYCNDEAPWNIYLAVKAKLFRKMLVSNTTITRGELISADKIQLIEKEIKNKKYLSDLSHAIGHEARRTIRPFQIINSSMLQKALLIRKKESVLIYAQNKSLRISMQGTALKSGHKNEMIKVRNNSSNKIIDAIVIDRGIVAINF